jgi:hypothetical protein
MYDIDRFCIVTSIILSRLFKKIIRVFLGILVKQSTIIKQILVFFFFFLNKYKFCTTNQTLLVGITVMWPKAAV